MKKGNRKDEKKMKECKKWGKEKDNEIGKERNRTMRKTVLMEERKLKTILERKEKKRSENYLVGSGRKVRATERKGRKSGREGERVYSRRYAKKGGSGMKKTLAQALLRGVNWEVG